MANCWRKTAAAGQCRHSPHQRFLDTLDASAFRSIARGGDLATVLDGMDQASAAGMKIKVNMVPLRGQNLDQVMPLLDYCLERGYELRFIERCEWATWPATPMPSCSSLSAFSSC
jgi:molybdenum cofactor biosynthesis enzyme MoaA